MTQPQPQPQAQAQPAILPPPLSVVPRCRKVTPKSGQPFHEYFWSMKDDKDQTRTLKIIAPLDLSKPRRMIITTPEFSEYDHFPGGMYSPSMVYRVKQTLQVYHRRLALYDKLGERQGKFLSTVECQALWPNHLRNEKSKLLTDLFARLDSLAELERKPNPEDCHYRTKKRNLVARLAKTLREYRIRHEKITENFAFGSGLLGDCLYRAQKEVLENAQVDYLRDKQPITEIDQGYCPDESAQCDWIWDSELAGVTHADDLQAAVLQFFCNVKTLDGWGGPDEDAPKKDGVSNCATLPRNFVLPHFGRMQRFFHFTKQCIRQAGYLFDRLTAPPSKFLQQQHSESDVASSTQNNNSNEEQKATEEASQVSMQTAQLDAAPAPRLGDVLHVLNAAHHNVHFMDYLLMKLKLFWQQVKAAPKHFYRQVHSGLQALWTRKLQQIDVGYVIDANLRAALQDARLTPETVRLLNALSDLICAHADMQAWIRSWAPGQEELPDKTLNKSINAVVDQWFVFNGENALQGPQKSKHWEAYKQSVKRQAKLRAQLFKGLSVLDSDQLETQGKIQAKQGHGSAPEACTPEEMARLEQKKSAAQRPPATPEVLKKMPDFLGRKALVHPVHHLRVLRHRSPFLRLLGALRSFGKFFLSYSERNPITGMVALSLYGYGVAAIMVPATLASVLTKMQLGFLKIGIGPSQALGEALASGQTGKAISVGFGYWKSAVLAGDFDRITAAIAEEFAENPAQLALAMGFMVSFGYALCGLIPPLEEELGHFKLYGKALIGAKFGAAVADAIAHPCEDVLASTVLWLADLLADAFGVLIDPLLAVWRHGRYGFKSAVRAFFRAGGNAILRLVKRCMALVIELVMALIYLFQMTVVDFGFGCINIVWEGISRLLGRTLTTLGNLGPLGRKIYAVHGSRPRSSAYYRPNWCLDAKRAKGIVKQCDWRYFFSTGVLGSIVNWANKAKYKIAHIILLPASLCVALYKLMLLLCVALTFLLRPLALGVRFSIDRLLVRPFAIIIGQLLKWLGYFGNGRKTAPGLMFTACAYGVRQTRARLGFHAAGGVRELVNGGIAKCLAFLTDAYLWLLRPATASGNASAERPPAKSVASDYSVELQPLNQGKGNSGSAINQSAPQPELSPIRASLLAATVTQPTRLLDYECSEGYTWQEYEEFTLPACAA